jgi:transposase-like protein
MSVSTITGPDNGVMSSYESPSGGDGPRRRRSFTAEDKLRYLAAYEKACETGEGGAYLRREGLYSSLMSEWRRLRDAGVLGADDAAVSRAPRRSGLTAEQAEIARLKKELAQANSKLETTQTALDIMGKAHALLEQISESADSEPKRGKR